MTVVRSDQPAFHGYAPASDERGYRPPMSIVISRETGSRGRSIAERVAEILDWEYVDQESLEYQTQFPTSHETPTASATGAVADWVQARLDHLNRDGALVSHPQMGSLVRRILESASVKHCVILARGAGRVLPEDARLHVKIVAPVDQRVAFIAEVNRMSTSDARQFVMEKDAARDAFLSAKLGADTTDLTQYDLIVNTSHLGVEAAAQIISAAAREKESFLERRVDERPWRVGMP